MYPLNAVLIGNSEKHLPHIRRELANHDVKIEAEFLDVGSAVTRLGAPPGEMRLFLHVASGRDVSQLKRLSGTFVGRPVLALIDDGHNPAALIAAMRAGAVQVVP